ncbi:hypothetical protein ACOYW6_09060 [Parablastomonas sp. CN1-191]|uniref:hypothetical protein n=1 Tax=Parablastomonas sp. CN1-191 TaxID=3400908 RepID=UPI003BF8DD93
MLSFGPKLNTVFASRWKALWWSAGILMTAYCTVPSSDQADDGTATQHVAAKGPHHSPWDK